MNGTTKLRRVGLLLAAATIAVATVCAAAEKPKPKARARRSRPQLKVGQVAPDVELAPLALEKNEKGELVPRIGRKKVKLSTFKGKAPVCIFSSSYT